MNSDDAERWIISNDQNAQTEYRSLLNKYTVIQLIHQLIIQILMCKIIVVMRMITNEIWHAYT